MGRTPPTRLVTVATGVREALQSLVRRMVPPPVSVLELASGFMTTQLLYAVARLGVADVLGVRSLPADEVAPELVRWLRRSGDPDPRDHACGYLAAEVQARRARESLRRPARSGLRLVPVAG